MKPPIPVVLFIVLGLTTSAFIALNNPREAVLAFMAYVLGGLAMWVLTFNPKRKP